MFAQTFKPHISSIYRKESIMEEITPDLTKNYLTEEPFFVTDSKTGEVHILRSADFWENPLKNGRR